MSSRHYSVSSYIWVNMISDAVKYYLNCKSGRPFSGASCVIESTVLAREEHKGGREGGERGQGGWMKGVEEGG